MHSNANLPVFKIINFFKYTRISNFLGRARVPRDKKPIERLDFDRGYANPIR